MDITPDEAAELNTRLIVAINVVSRVSKRLKFIDTGLRRQLREGGAEVAARIDKALLELARVADEIGAHRSQ